MKTLKIAILGFGNAGRAFAKLLLDKAEEIKGVYDTEVLAVAITTGTRGNLIDPQGIDLTKALWELESTGKFDPKGQAYSALPSMEVAKTVDYDVLVELTPLDIFSGQPATDHIKAALLRKKHAITANKGPIAWAYRELRDLAKAQGSLFFFETAVMDGTPVFNLVEDTLKFCKICAVQGILNTTTNFILEELAAGQDYDAVIAEGKRRGFIEADPAMDIEGWDAAAKTTALLNVFMDAGITPMDIDRKGIEDIREKEIKEAGERGKKIKLLCSGTIENGKVVGKVAPIEVNKESLEASIDGTSSLVSITTDLMGTLSMVEHAPEIEQTAYGIFSDLVRIMDRLK